MKKVKRQTSSGLAKKNIHVDVPTTEEKTTNRQLDAQFDLAARTSWFKIHYIFPHQYQDLEQASVFGWFTTGLHQIAHPLIKIASLPADIRELFCEPTYALVPRLTRRIWPNLTPVDINVLEQLAEGIPGPFRVFISSDPDTATRIDGLIPLLDGHALHVSSVNGIGRVALNRFDVPRLLSYCRAAVTLLGSDPKFVNLSRFIEREMTSHSFRRLRDHLLPRGLHNTTTPNERALEAFGRRLKRSSPLVPCAPEPRRYINRICQSADAVTVERELLLRDMRPSLISNRYIVAVQSMHWGHFKNYQRTVSTAETKVRKVLKVAYANMIHATTYFDEMTGLDADSMLKDPLFHQIMAQRGADAHSFTAGLTALAAANLTPVLRLEPKLNQVRGDLKLLGSCVRAHGESNFEWKQSRLVKRIGEKMRSLVDPAFLSRIDKPERGAIEGLKLVTDLPLELMLTCGLPLAMRFNVSRLPVMPGNLYLANCLMPPKIIPLEQFDEVLVIRSFQPNDPLKLILQRSIELILNKLPKAGVFSVNVRFVDVASADEFVAALDGFNGAMMIFDGHGAYDTDGGLAKLIVGETKVGVWELRSRCVVPPIVIFSACDTHPLDGSHSSTANAALALGARTVLGTTLPIDGMKAGIFIGRLFLRIAQFLPLILKHQTVVCWRDFVSGMLRMMHVTEVLGALRKNAGPAYQGISFDPVQLRANSAINQGKPNWHKEFLDELSLLVKIPIENITQDIEKWAAMTDSMKYVQLGNPENIVIVEKDAQEILNEKVAVA